MFYYNIVIIKHMIQSIQKVIKIGSSGGVTIPAKEMKRQNIKFGDEVKITIVPTNVINGDNVELVKLTQKLIKRHEQALKNLSQR